MIYTIGAIVFCTLIAGAVIYFAIQSINMNKHGKGKKG